MQNFGSLLRLHRENNCLSQEELAAKCSFSRAYLAKMESRNKPAPPKKTVLAIAKAMKLSKKATDELWHAAQKERLQIHRNENLFQNIHWEVNSLADYLIQNLEREKVELLKERLSLCLSNK